MRDRGEVIDAGGSEDDGVRDPADDDDDDVRDRGVAAASSTR